MRWLLVVLVALGVIGSTTYFGAGVDIKDIQGLCAAQEAYFKRTGTYYQVMRGNVKPEREAKVAKDALGGTVPDNIEITTYERDGEKGYQVIYDDGTMVRSCGSGPETAERIAPYPYPSPPPPTNVASSTL